MNIRKVRALEKLAKETTGEISKQYKELAWLERTGYGEPDETEVYELRREIEQLSEKITEMKERSRPPRTVDYDEEGNLNISHEILQGRDISSIRFLRETEYECSGKAFEGRDENGRPVYSYRDGSRQFAGVVPKNSSDYPWCPSCGEHVAKPYYNGCPKCETPVVYSNGKQYPFTKEMIAELEKWYKREEKWQGSSRLGKIGLWFAELFTPSE